MNTTSPLNVFLIGCGGIADAHLPAFETHPEHFRLLGASDPSAPSRNAVAARFAAQGPVRTYAEHGEGLADLAGKIDAVLILTPHFLHYPAAKDALNAGLHVLVEKPATHTLAEAVELADLADAKGLRVMVGQTRRFDPRYIFLRDWLRKNPKHFGALRTFEMCGWQNIEAWISTKPDRNADFWILDKHRAGGGVVISLLVHAIDLLRFLFEQDYAMVSAHARFDAPFKNGAESSCCALLTTEGGATGTLHGNYLARKTPYCESIKFFGEQGCIGDLPLTLGSYSGPAYYGSTEGKTPDNWNFQFEGLQAPPAALPAGLSANAFTNQLLAFHREIREGLPCGSGIRDNLNTIATVEAIYASMNHGGALTTVKKGKA